MSTHAARTRRRAGTFTGYTGGSGYTSGHFAPRRGGVRNRTRLFRIG